ncbi:MAG: TlpA disulfide reductase family protein [Bryobacteraceae bacterium]
MLSKKLPLFNALVVAVMLAGSLYALNPKLPRPLADISLDAPGAKRVNVRQGVAKARIIAVLSSSCEHCITMVSALSKIERQYRARGVQVFGALVDEEAGQQLQKFIATTKPSFPIGTLSQDNTRRLADFGIADHPFVPILMFVDGKNMVRYQFDNESKIFNGSAEVTVKKMLELTLAAK